MKCGDSSPFDLNLKNPNALSTKVIHLENSDKNIGLIEKHFSVNENALKVHGESKSENKPGST